MTYFQETYAFIDSHRLQTIQGNLCTNTTREQEEGARVNKRRNSSRSICSRSSKLSSVRSQNSLGKNEKSNKQGVRGLTRRISLAKLFSIVTLTVMMNFIKNKNKCVVDVQIQLYVLQIMIWRCYND